MNCVHQLQPVRGVPVPVQGPCPTICFFLKQSWRACGSDSFIIDFHSPTLCIDFSGFCESYDITYCRWWNSLIIFIVTPTASDLTFYNCVAGIKFRVCSHLYLFYRSGPKQTFSPKFTTTESLTLHSLFTSFEGLFSVPQRLFPESELCGGGGHRFRWLVDGTVRFCRLPSGSHLCLPLLFSYSVAQQAALENRLHRGPQIVLPTKRTLCILTASAGAQCSAKWFTVSGYITALVNNSSQTFK